MKLLDKLNTFIPVKYRTAILHISIWVTLFTVIFSYGTMMGRDFNLAALVPNILYVSLFYLNYSLLVEKLLFNRRVWAYVLCNIIVFTLVYFLMRELGEFVTNFTEDPPRQFNPRRHFGGHILFSILVIAPSLSVKMTTKWFDTQKKINESEMMRKEMELASLKNQLNPHFLFNALNNIYALIAFQPKTAQSSLLNVCDLLRYQLYESDLPKVELENEVKFLENYSKLMKLRISDSVRINIDLPSNIIGVRVAPLLFISLVENAFKHGVSNEDESFIDIKLTVVESEIIFICKNSNYPKTQDDRSGSGIGLVNLRRRLELIYPHSHSYKINSNEKYYEAVLIINTGNND